MWLRTVARLSGRPVLVPEAEELVALGAAAQAAAVLEDRAAEDVAAGWARPGPGLGPLPRDGATLTRHRAVAAAADELNQR